MIGPGKKPWAERANRREKALDSWPPASQDAGGLAFVLAGAVSLGALVLLPILGLER